MRVSLRSIGRYTIAAAAIGFASVTYTWMTLPDVRPLRTENPTTTAFIALRADEARAAGRPVHAVQRWIPYSRIAPDLIRAAVVAEDGAFWDHDGVDYFEIRESLHDTFTKGESLRGASTITMQLAKNLYLSPSRSPYRKLAELFITRRLEAALSKRRILELYLNLIEWGDGIWGCEAAAEVYFGKSAADLSTDEAALLAATIASPHTATPAHPTGNLRWHQRLILQRMGK
jgi:monofunctional biosynthetic peptidoglycan transglycosylase